MRVEYTNDEKRRLGELIAAIKALDTRDADFYAQHPYPDELDGEPVSFTVPADDNENATFWQQHAQLREIWEQTAPAGWWEEHLLRERKNAEDGLALQKRMDDIKHKAKDRAFASLGNDPFLIRQDAEEVIQEFINTVLEYYRDQERLGGSMPWSSFDVLSLGGGNWKLDASVIKDMLVGPMPSGEKNGIHYFASHLFTTDPEGVLHRHYKALEGLRDLTGALHTDLLDAYIDNILSKHPHILWPEDGQDYSAPVTPLTVLVRTTVPQVFVSPTDKVTKAAFGGLLTSNEQRLKMEGRKSKKQITTVARINFDAPQLQGLKGLNYFDRMVYDAIATLFINGNEYITTQMIYQVMTGLPNNYATEDSERRITESVTKFMYGGVYIDATEEAKARNLPGDFIYDTNLLHAERMRQNLNGTVTDCLRLLKTPVLFQQASEKNQIGRVPITALAAPVRNTEDVMALKAYLLERVFAMKGSKTAERDISYNTIYEKLWGAEADSASRMKKKRIRDHASTIMQHFCSTKDNDGAPLIKKAVEYKVGKAAAGLRVTL